MRDVNRERGDLRRLYDAVVARARPAAWFYGHFHSQATLDVHGTCFVLLNGLEIRSV